MYLTQQREVKFNNAALATLHLVWTCPHHWSYSRNGNRIWYVDQKLTWKSINLQCHLLMTVLNTNLIYKGQPSLCTQVKEGWKCYLTEPWHNTRREWKPKLMVSFLPSLAKEKLHSQTNETGKCGIMTCCLMFLRAVILHSAEGMQKLLSFQSSSL